MRKINILCLISIVFASIGYAQLVNRYSFNGNCNDSVGTNHGTLANITGNSHYSGGMLVLGNTGVERTTGNIGNDPNNPVWPLGDYVDLPNGTLHNAADSNAFSIEMWVRIDAQPETEISLFDFGHTFYPWGPYTGIGEVAPTQAYPYVVDVDYGTDVIFGDTSAKRTYFSPFSPTDPNERWRWQSPFNLSYPGIFTAKNNISVPTTGTVHIVCSYKIDKHGSDFYGDWHLNAAMYVNGQFVGEQTSNSNACDFSIWPDASGGNTAVDLNCWLGRSQQRYAKYLQGAYDEVRIYNHALSPAEAAYNYSVGPNNYCQEKLEGDLDGDCFVNMDDFSMLYTHWLNQSPRKAVKDSLIHRWELNGDLTDSVGDKDGTLVSESASQYKYGENYFEVSHPFPYTSNNLNDTTQPTKGTSIRLPNGILTGLTNATIEMFVSESEWRFDAQHFYLGANDQYWVKTSTWKKREDPLLGGLSSQDSGCNPFFKFQSYLSRGDNRLVESMQAWWHQGLGHWLQNIYVFPALMYDDGKVHLNRTHIAITVENDVPGIWNWTKNRATQPGDPNTDSFGPGDRITFYSDGRVANQNPQLDPNTPAINIRPQHEGPNFQDPYAWDDTRGGTVTPNGYLEAGEAQGWKETANFIGRSPFATQCANARYYDFRIYNRALTAAEILDSYNAGSEAEICTVAGDINADCVVDLTDFAILAKDWFLDAVTY